MVLTLGGAIAPSMPVNVGQRCRSCRIHQVATSAPYLAASGQHTVRTGPAVADMSRAVTAQARTPLLSAQVGHSDHVSSINKAHKDWENPQVYQRNRLGSHVPLVSHTQQSFALTQFSDVGQPSASNVIWLSGTQWRFNLFEMPESVTPDFHDPSFDSSQWSKVTPCS